MNDSSPFLRSVLPAKTSLTERALGPLHQLIPAQRLSLLAQDGHGAQLAVDFADGSRAPLEIKALKLDGGSGEAAWYLQLGQRMSHDVVPRGESLPLSTDATAETLELAAGGSRLSIGLGTPGFRLERAGVTIWESPGPDLNVGDIAASHALFKHAMGRGGYGLSVGLHHRERLYGGGESFQAFVKNGMTLDLRNADALGVNGNAQYQATPYLWSSRGVGLAMLGAAPSRVDVGATRHDVLVWASEQEGLPLLVQTGGTPEAQWHELRSLKAPPRGVPDWSLGLWLSRCYYRDQAEIEAVLGKAREHGVKVDVLNLDARCWMRADTRTDFVWDESRFDPYERYLPSLRERDIRVCLWENPYVSSRSTLYQEGVERGFFARTSRGAVYPLEWVPTGLAGFPKPPVAGLVDFTRKDAWEWWKDLHRPYIRAGVQCFKTDFGEEIPEDACFADGSTGHELRNAYADLYNACVTEVLAEELGGEGVVWARSGWLATAATPVKWAGDSQSSWRALRATLRAGLSQAMGGALFWSHDVGGFYGPPPSPDLFLRWAQLGLYGSHVRLHGTSAREPWVFGGEVLASFRQALALRRSLLPYWRHTAARAVHEGSFLKPLLAVFPDDSATHGIDDQLMVGKDLMVAPLLEADGGREFYLPPGTWLDLRDGSVRDGRSQQKTERTPQLPAFARLDSAFIELFRAAPAVLSGGG